DAAIGGINTLDRVTVGSVYLVVVNLVQVGFQNLAAVVGAVYVVLVRRVGGPVAARRVDFDADQAVTREAHRDRVDNLAGGAATAPNLNSAVGGRDQPRRAIPVRSGPPCRHLEAIGVRGQREFGLAGQIDGIGHPAEHVGPPPDLVP